MYSYIEGIVKEIESDYITIENNGIGFLVYTSLPYSFNVNNTYKLYLYQNVREDEISLYGFKSKEEKNLFLKLINVKGIGCKMALPILAVNDPNLIIDAIEREDISYLKKFPKIGEKVARQIILDLKGKLVSTAKNTKNHEELIEALKALGYKNSDINVILPNITSEKVEDQIKEAFKLLLK